jgi:5-methyltetrahydropteroyltriglutamate--homocysteine methyltransferase
MSLDDVPRSDQVGSLRRPNFLWQAREQFHAGVITQAQLQETEDSAIRDALQRQRDAGVDIVTDGEYRRDAWQTDISDALDGFVAEYPTRSQRLPDGTTAILELHTKGIERKLRQVRRITAHEAEFMRANANAPFKITLPSPNAVIWGSYQGGLTDKVYSTRDELRQDLIPIYQAEMAALVSEGIQYIQLDEGFTRYGVPGWRENMQSAGLDPDEALATDIATENAIYDSVERDGVILGSHLCRGSRTTTRGAGNYEDFAERLFAGLHVDRFLLEDDAGQLGSYELLKFLPPSKTVVLGLVTTKYPDLEDPDELRRATEQAAEHCSLEQLAISPQCGFGGSADNDFMSYEHQFVKLENLANVARTIWA